VAGGVANAAIAGAMAGLVGSAAGDLMSSGTLNFGDVLKGAAIGGLTGGLTSGITLDGSGIGFSVSGSPDSLASLAGVQSVGNSLVPQAGASTAGSLPEQALALAGEATVQAGVQTAIDRGSFLTSLRNSAVSDVAAAGAYAIGNANLAGDFGTGAQEELEYVAAHAALGCAASAAAGTGCAGGAIGGATSALVAPYLVDQAGGLENLTADQRAAIVTVSTLLGGSAAAVLGQNVTGAATAATNESLNNATNVEDLAHGRDLVPLEGGGGGPAEDYIPESIPSNSGGVGDDPVATNTASELAFGDNGRKMDFLFNNNIDSSNAYNAARAAGNASRIGMADTPANRAEVTLLFNQAYNDPSSIVGPGTVPGSNLREFYLPGVTGTGSKIQFVELNGKVLTIIAK